MRNDNFNVAKKLNWLKKVLSFDKKMNPSLNKIILGKKMLAKNFGKIFFDKTFLAQKRKLAFFFAKNLKLAFFFAKNSKLAQHRNWQNYENCIFGQLVLICWPFEHLLHTQNINIIADLGGCWWGYDWKRRVKALQTFRFVFFSII